MANKIYDFLPAHLQNKDLEEIFDATLERVFSKGNLEKTRAYIGRREKGLNNNDDAYYASDGSVVGRPGGRRRLGAIGGGPKRRSSGWIDRTLLAWGMHGGTSVR